MRFYILILFVLLMFSCNGSSPMPKKTNDSRTPKTDVSMDKNKVPVYTYEIVKEYKHDKKAFTQGLVIHEGFFYEGTGGHEGDDFDSSLRKVEIESGKVLQKIDLSDDYFGEGIVVLNDKIYQLTWKSGICFVYDLKTFKLLKELTYNGEGWGLTTDGTKLYMSDGLQYVHVLDPETFNKERTLSVVDEKGKPIYRLNELEFVKGEIWANVWQEGKIARINPEDGKLLGWIDLTNLAQQQMREDRNADVLNGIAYDAENDRLFVTGKLWKKLFEIKVLPKQ